MEMEIGSGGGDWLHTQTGGCIRLVFGEEVCLFLFLDEQFRFHL